MTASCAPPKTMAASAEEKNNLQRSNRKNKFPQETNTVNNTKVNMTSAQEEKTTSSSQTFKDALMKLTNGEGISDTCWGDLLNAELPENKWYKDDIPNVATEPRNLTSAPIVTISDEEIAELAKPWKNTLIVKVLGKRVNYKMIENKLRREWVKNGTMSITDMADDFYLVKLSDIEDYRHALFEGPWKVADHYLIVQRWRPFFSLTA